MPLDVTVYFLTIFTISELHIVNLYLEIVFDIIGIVLYKKSHCFVWCNVIPISKKSTI